MVYLPVPMETTSLRALEDDLDWPRNGEGLRTVVAAAVPMEAMSEEEEDPFA